MSIDEQSAADRVGKSDEQILGRFADRKSVV